MNQILALQLMFESVISYRVKWTCQCNVFEHNVTIHWCHEFAANCSQLVS